MPSTEPDNINIRDSYTHVAVGVLQNAHAKILICRRHEHLHQGGLWEFPGGKVEQDEDVLHALQREFREEVGITIESAEPLIQIPFRYPDKSVLLDVFRVTAFFGEASGMEGQDIQWIATNQLNSVLFPEANRAIIHAVQLPDSYMITGKSDSDEDFLSRLTHSLKQGIRLVQVRDKQRSEPELIRLLEKVKVLCHEYQAQLLINSSVELATKLGVGLHLNSQGLKKYKQRPIGQDKWLCVSVHNEEELQQANMLGADFVVLSPVLPTDSHPGAPTLGWEKFSHLVSRSSVPVFALGGMAEDTCLMARQSGAQGIAAITAFWKKT